MAVLQPISDQLLVQCLGQPQVYERLGWLCDHVGGRTSGTESGARGEQWAFDLFTEWGLKNVHFEEFPVTAWVRGSIDVRVTEPVSWRLTALAHGNAPRDARTTGGVIDLEHGEREAYVRLKDRVRGAIVLCDEGASPGKRVLHRSEKLSLGLEFGAAALMISSSASGGLPRTGVCHRVEAPIPSFGISLEDGARLRRLMAQDVVPQVEITLSNVFINGQARNVLAEIPGHEYAEEVVMAGAHLDSWDIAQGATDNGLGCAIVLEAARALARDPLNPRRTIRFAIWAAEETGLYGSINYVHRHQDELSRFAALMNFDMTGDPYGYGLPGRRDPGPLLRSLVTQLAPLGMRDDFSSQAYLHSDHQPFMLEGVPIVQLLSRLEGEGGHYYHSVGDTFEKISLPALCRAAAVAAHTLRAIADEPERPFERFTPAEVRAMIDESDLYEALVAEGYHGPPMMSVTTPLR